MAHLPKFLSLCHGYPAFDEEGVALVTMAGEVHSFLGVHGVIHEVREELDVSLRLHRATHNPEGGPKGAILCSETRDDGVKRTLAGSKCVWMALRKTERVTPVLEADAGAPRDDTTPETHV